MGIFMCEITWCLSTLQKGKFICRAAISSSEPSPKIELNLKKSIEV